MITKRKKNVRQRAKTTHGYGSMKKNRGAGHRGGRGNAGSGKRGDAKKPSMIKQGRFNTNKGFKSKSRTLIVPINLRYIESRADFMLRSGLAKEEAGLISINLSDIGCEKLLGNGAVTRKYKITCDSATEKAIAAVKKAGGEVVVKAQEAAEAAEADEASAAEKEPVTEQENASDAEASEKQNS